MTSHQDAHVVFQAFFSALQGCVRLVLKTNISNAMFMNNTNLVACQSSHVLPSLSKIEALLEVHFFEFFGLEVVMRFHASTREVARQVLPNQPPARRSRTFGRKNQESHPSKACWRTAGT